MSNILCEMETDEDMTEDVPPVETSEGQFVPSPASSEVQGFPLAATFEGQGLPPPASSEGQGLPPPENSEGQGFPPPATSQSQGFPPPASSEGQGFPPPTSSEDVHSVETPKDVPPPFVRRHYHPDDIIKGKPRVAKFRMRRRKPAEAPAYSSEEIRENELNDGHEMTEEEVEFDRERPDRFKLSEDGQMEGGKDADEEKVVLMNMMADLQTETLVLIGDVRLNPSVEAEHMKNMKEWEDYKIEHNITKWKPRKLPQKTSPKNTSQKYASIFERANLLSSSGKNKRQKKKKQKSFFARSPRKTGSTLFSV